MCMYDDELLSLSQNKIMLCYVMLTTIRKSDKTKNGSYNFSDFHFIDKIQEKENKQG